MQRVLVGPAAIDAARANATRGSSDGAPSREGDAAHLVRGRLARRVVRLLAIGPVDLARAGAQQGDVVSAFGGRERWRTLADPWIAARSLARERDTLAGSDARPAQWFGIVRRA